MNRINRIHERSLRIVYRDEKSSFEELLRTDNSFTVHVRNIQCLEIELYKVENAISPQFMNDTFPHKANILHCSKQDFVTKRTNSVHSGTETLSFLGPNIWLPW